MKEAPGVSMIEGSCNILEIEHREKNKEWLGQLIEPPEHYIIYREYTDKRYIKEQKRELIIGTSFKGNENILKLHEFIIRPKLDFKRFKNFVDSVRLCLAEQLWKYVEENTSNKSIDIRIPQTLIKFYEEVIKQGMIDDYIEGYILPRFKGDTEPLTSIIILHILLDMLIKFFEKNIEENKNHNSAIEKIVKKFEKRIENDISLRFAEDEYYIVVDIDEIENIKREGIRGLKIIKKEESKKEVLEQIGLNPSLLHLYHRIVQESINISS